MDVSLNRQSVKTKKDRLKPNCFPFSVNEFRINLRISFISKQRQEIEYDFLLKGNVIDKNIYINAFELK